MAETMKKAVIIEFDFVALKGAELLYEVTSKLMNSNDIEWSASSEARYLAGHSYLRGFTDFFAAIKTKKTPAKAAKDLADAFAAEITRAVPTGLTPAFKSFIQSLAAKGLKVVLSTRADLEKVKPAFEGLLSDEIVLHQEESRCYGAVRLDAWRRICSRQKLNPSLTLALVGSGMSVKSALLAGIGSIALLQDHVAYQDFSGVDALVKKLDSSVAQAIFKSLRVS